jgi:hypothetical protein
MKTEEVPGSGIIGSEIFSISRENTGFTASIPLAPD